MMDYLLRGIPELRDMLIFVDPCKGEGSSAVSISKDYPSLSQQFMVTFFRVNNCFPDLARFVRPGSPVCVRPVTGWDGKISGMVVMDLEPQKTTKQEEYL